MNTDKYIPIATSTGEVNKKLSWLKVLGLLGVVSLVFALGVLYGHNKKSTALSVHGRPSAAEILAQFESENPAIAEKVKKVREKAKKGGGKQGKKDDKGKKKKGGNAVPFHAPGAVQFGGNAVPSHVPGTDILAHEVLADQTLQAFREQTLAKHNQLRKLHGVGDLVQDPAIDTVAQAWAEHIVSTGSFAHSSNSYGENLYFAGFVGGPEDLSADAAVQAWYDEIKDYDYNNPGFSMATGHFTQVVWKGSTKLGTGYAYEKFYYEAYKVWVTYAYVVCNYSPAGNSGGYASNVPAKV